LTESISSWAELEARIAALPSEQERGEAFEQFCKAFFVLDPVFQFEKVYRQNEIPQSLRQKLGYPGIQDIGIDGLAVTIDEKLFAYQAKFRSDRKDMPTLRELSTFFTVSDRANWRITITNANSLPTAINDRTNQSRILVDRFDQLDSDFFDRLRLYLKEQRIEPQKKKTPHQTQQEAIESALSYFKESNRGQLILPCGTGKTLVAMWIAEKIGGNRILIMVPSLSLMSQTLREWAANTSLKPFRYLCLCSDTTVDLGKDSPVEHLYEMDVPVTTDTGVVSEFLKNEPSIISILLSTYQSSKVLTEAVKNAGIDFDTAIFDEAHRTTGSDVGVWNMAIDDKNVSIKKRIFMTATPRIYAPHISKKAKEKDILLYSMDDNEIYGKPFYEMTFGQAIEKNLITDYKVVIICVTDREVREIIQQGGEVTTDDSKEWDAKAFAKQVALVKALNAYNLKKVFTFHSRVPSAKAFTQPDSPYSIKEVIKLAGASTADKNINLFHVNGTMSSGYRNGIMKEFRESEIGIMSNARCLIEGVDVPAVDTVAFIDPKKSIIDIVQATGRALRKAEWKEKGYIFIPVVVDEDTTPEDFLKSSDFDTVWEVLQAMMGQDQRLESIVSQLRTMQGENKEDSEKWQNIMSEYAEKVEFYKLTEKIDHKRFIKKLYTKTIELIARSWDFWYGLTLRHKEEFGEANAPYEYTTSEGFKLGQWQTDQRQFYKKGKISKDRIQKLQDVGFKWFKYEELLDEKFKKGLHETIRYKEYFGSPNAPQGYKTPEGYALGSWQMNLRKYYKKGKLSPYRIKRLEEIGFKWLPKDEFMQESFDKGISETLNYKKQFNDSNAPQTYKTQTGYPLGLWQANIRQYYKNRQLAPDRLKLLEEIGFKWVIKEDAFEKAFENGFQKTLEFKAQNKGNPNASRSVNLAGFKLGSWQSEQRQLYRKKLLASDRIKRLEEIGFKWVLKDEAFEKGFRESLRYKEQSKSLHAPNKYITDRGYKLGKWQSEQRTKYKNSKLSSDKIYRLEDIGFKWNIDEERRVAAFEKGFQETLKYSEQYDNPNAPKNYKTEEGYLLGIWQVNLRQFYKKGQLSGSDIHRLEKIGFKWDTKEAAFERGIQETLKYKEQSGNPNAPKNYKMPQKYPLGAWQKAQRFFYQKGILSPDRIKRLEEIGFEWDPHEAAFKKGMQGTIMYKKQFGKPNAPNGYVTPEGFKLGQWQAVQIYHYRNGKLSPDRTKKLEEIGFKWGKINRRRS